MRGVKRGGVATGRRGEGKGDPGPASGVLDFRWAWGRADRDDRG